MIELEPDMRFALPRRWDGPDLERAYLELILISNRRRTNACSGHRAASISDELGLNMMATLGIATSPGAVGGNKHGSGVNHHQRQPPPKIGNADDVCIRPGMHTISRWTPEPDSPGSKRNRHVVGVVLL